MLAVKVTYLNETRRVSFSDSVVFETLLQHFKDLFPAAKAFRVQYYDEDQDLVTINTDAELREAFQRSRASEGLLKLHLTPVEAEDENRVITYCGPMRPISFDIKSFAKARAKRVALTFNGGPSVAPYLDQTTRILDLLAASTPNRVAATFFIVGSRLDDQTNPQGPLVESMYVRGHLIANGGYSGTDYTNTSLFPTEMSIVTDIQKNAYAIQNVSVPYPRYFRSFLGRSDARLESVLASLGLTNTLWTYDSQDTVNIAPNLIADGIVAWVTQNDTSIINLTCGGSDQNRTIDALTNALPRLQALGCTFVTVQTLATSG